MSRRFFFALAIAPFAARVAAAKFPSAPWGGSGEPFGSLAVFGPLDVEEFIHSYMEPTVLALAEKIEADLLASWDAFVLSEQRPVVARRGSLL